MGDEIPENIDRFNRITIAFLSELYASFPEPLTFDPHLLGVNASGEDFEGDQEVQQPRAFAWMDAATSTINWLRDEGFIKSDGSDLEGNEIGVVLTALGLQAIGRTPEVLIPQKAGKPFSEVVKEHMKGAAKDVASEAIKQLISAGIQLATGG